MKTRNITEGDQYPHPLLVTKTQLPTMKMFAFNECNRSNGVYYNVVLTLFRIWWSVTRFKLNFPFMVIYICAKYDLNLSILSWVIIRTWSFSQSWSKKRGNYSVKIWWSVTRFDLHIPFQVLYIYAKYY